jgi:hypothetical protein|uniref:Uncharacterized protein n=1 Tax=Mimiviridae sp. ChoanoV1 TaxID=2596887 RepID=A0A5B8HXR1_9VIRU|nr:hypothetical protein 2_82 [Mimiviridae sp. ChoanoV1]
MNQQNLFLSICIIYMIVYLVTKIWFNPNYELFSQGKMLTKILSAIGSSGLIEIKLKKPEMKDNEKLLKYQIEILSNNNPILMSEIIDSLTEEIKTHIIQDERILDDKEYSINVKSFLENKDKDVVEISSIPYKFVTNNRNQNIIELNKDLINEIDKDKKIFLKQEGEQNIQNRIISDLQNRVEQLRKDIVILTNKDKDEYRNIQHLVKNGDSVSQALSVPGQINGIDSSANLIQKNYRVNLNLD